MAMGAGLGLDNSTLAGAKESRGPRTPGGGLRVKVKVNDSKASLPPGPCVHAACDPGYRGPGGQKRAEGSGVYWMR